MYRDLQRWLGPQYVGEYRIGYRRRIRRVSGRALRVEERYERVFSHRIAVVTLDFIVAPRTVRGAHFKTKEEADGARS